MQTGPTREFPDSLDGIQLRTGRWQEVEGKTLDLLSSPLAMESGVVIASIVGDDDDASAAARAGATKVFQKLEAGEGVELIRLALKEEHGCSSLGFPGGPESECQSGKKQRGNNQGFHCFARRAGYGR